MAAATTPQRVGKDAASPPAFQYVWRSEKSILDFGGFILDAPAVDQPLHRLTGHRSLITSDAALTGAAEASDEVSASE